MADHSLIPRSSPLFKMAVESNFPPWGPLWMSKSPPTCALRSLIPVGCPAPPSWGKPLIGALMIGSYFGQLDAVNFLIKHGAGAHHKDNLGYTALHHAVTHDLGSSELLSCLIKNGANVNARANDNRTPLMIASEYNHVNSVIFLTDHGANIDLQDREGYSSLHYAAGNISDLCDVLDFLITNGADVNAFTNDKFTPLIIASNCNNLNVVNSLIKYGANIHLVDRCGRTALHYSITVVDHDSVTVLRSLIKNGADVNALTNDNCSPLMMSSLSGSVNVVTILVENGANMDIQNQNGDTALHYAVCATRNSSEVVNKLLTLGASHLRNQKGLTPLLFASYILKHSLVEELIQRPEITKEQRIDALELLGASLTIWQRASEGSVNKYIKRGMEERFADSSNPLLKQPMEPVEAYQNRKECQTLEQLAQIEGDRNAMVIDSLLILERFFGTKDTELLPQIRWSATEKWYIDSYIRIGLYQHAIRVAHCCNQSAISDLYEAMCLLYANMEDCDLQRGKILLELLDQTVLEYKYQRKLGEQFGIKLGEDECNILFGSTVKLVCMISKFKYCEDSKTSWVSKLLRKLLYQNPRDQFGNTLLHLTEVFGTELFPCLDEAKLLLNAGFNVNAMNNDGDTPLHKAVKLLPLSGEKIQFLTDMLHVLFDGGAHHDFVNNDGKTPMDMAKTDEARMILSEKRNLELKCISARAVKKFRIPYLGVVPKTLEKYISMH
ncbi:Protein fem-1 B [Porites harrisoni]